MSINGKAIAQRRRLGGAGVVVVVTLVCLTAAGAAGYLILAGTAKAPEDSASRTADLARASVTNFDITVTASGELQARNPVEIRSELDEEATIVEIVPEGTYVQPGELLVHFNSDALEDELQDAEERLETAKAAVKAAEHERDIQINDNMSSERQARLKVMLAQLALEQWEEGDRVKRESELALTLERTARDHERLVRQYERSVRLYEQEFLSENEKEEDWVRMKNAEESKIKAELDAKIWQEYQSKMERAQMESDVDDAEAELVRLLSRNEIQLDNRELDLATEQDRLVRREEQLEDLQRQMAATTITAPSAGLVVYATSMESGRHGPGGDDSPLQIGRRVYPNQLIFILPDTSEMIASVRVHESLAGRIRRGQPAMVSIEALGGRVVSGRVESIGVLAETGGWRDPNLREYTVRIGVAADNAGGDMKPSMRCDAKITLGRVEDALSVPIQAVFNDGPVRYVYVPKGARFARVPVQVGRRSNTHAEILAGIDAGDTVLLRQPAPGEVLAGQWKEEQLALVGLTIDENGVPVASNQDAAGQMMTRPEQGWPGETAGPASPGGPGAEGQMMMRRGQGRSEGAAGPNARGEPGEGDRRGGGDGSGDDRAEPASQTTERRERTEPTG